KLSNGQTRRARIARALLSRPELLILDEPFMGLDSAGRDEVAALLGGLGRQGRRVLLITRPEAVPGWVTHVLELDHLAVRWQGRRADFLAECGTRNAECGIKESLSSIPPSTAAFRSHPRGVPHSGGPIIELRN